MNKKNIFNLLILIMLILASLITLPNISAQEDSEYISVAYLTGIGCPNCATTDPAILSDYTSEYPNLIVVEYELYSLGQYNQEVANEYFNSYLYGKSKGIPLVIFGEENFLMGRYDVLNCDEKIENLNSNEFPLPNGTKVSFENLDITQLEGKIKIWAKDRVLISGAGGNNEILKKFLTTENIADFLKNNSFNKIEAEPLPISQGEIEFENAAEKDGWIIQWSGNYEEKEEEKKLLNKLWYLIPAIILISAFLIYKRKKYGKVYLKPKEKNLFLLAIASLIIVTFFVIASSFSPESLEKIGYNLPLPIFTFFIAIVDGFNPCNLFVLTFLLGLLISASHSRKKIYAIGYTFIAVVFIIYFLFMAAWLNIFKYIGFTTPLRIIIASIALIAGAINVKEMFAFRKGVTLMIQEQHKKPLVKRIEKMKEKIKNGSIPTLILASIGLAAFASLVELPCTAGFPLIYTGILTGKGLASSFSYYLYLLLYNFVYVIPLIVIITIFGLTFKGKQINKRQMQIIKFIGGLIMIILGLILLINPSLIGIGV